LPLRQHVVAGDNERSGADRGHHAHIFRAVMPYVAMSRILLADHHISGDRDLAAQFVG
jgi:hypothetical protein